MACGGPRRCGSRERGGRRRGVELGLSGTAGIVDWSANYSFVRARFKSGEVLLGEANSSQDEDGNIFVPSGSTIPGIPAYSLKLNLGVHVTDKWRVGASMVAYSSQYARGNENNAHRADGEEFLHSGKIGGYAVFNLTTSYEFGNGLEVFAKVNNVFDKKYATGAILAENIFQDVRSAAVSEERGETFIAPRAPRAGWSRYDTLMLDASEAPPAVTVAPSDMSALMYTSGTTGRPKGAIRSHEGSTRIAMATALAMGFSARDIGLMVMTMCHANSLYFSHTFVHLGGTCVIDDRKSFDPEALLNTLASEHVTFTSLVPTHYIMMLGLPSEVRAKYDVSAVDKLMISSHHAADDYTSERSEAALDAIDQGAAEHEGHVQARQCDDAEDQQEEDPKVGRMGQVQPFHGGRTLLWEESHGACRNMPPRVMFERYRAKSLK